MTRFQWDPYVRRVPAVTAFATAGTSRRTSAPRAGHAGLRRGLTGGRPIRSSTSRAAATSGRTGWSAVRPGWGRSGDRGVFAGRPDRPLSADRRPGCPRAAARPAAPGHLDAGGSGGVARPGSRRRPGGTVIMPPGSRRASITPASAVRVSRWPAQSADDRAVRDPA